MVEAAGPPLWVPTTSGPATLSGTPALNNQIQKNLPRKPLSLGLSRGPPPRKPPSPPTDGNECEATDPTHAGRAASASWTPYCEPCTCLSCLLCVRRHSLCSPLSFSCNARYFSAVDFPSENSCLGMLGLSRGNGTERLLQSYLLAVNQGYRDG